MGVNQTKYIKRNSFNMMNKQLSFFLIFLYCSPANLLPTNISSNVLTNATVSTGRFNLTIPISQRAAATIDVSCTNSYSCGTNGYCDYSKSTCQCLSGYASRTVNEPCAYELKSRITAGCLSFFLGIFGADWFYLSQGNGGYIAAGVFKLLTGGGGGIWWLVDWIRVAASAFPDGNGVPLV